MRLRYTLLHGMILLPLSLFLSQFPSHSHWFSRSHDENPLIDKPLKSLFGLPKTPIKLLINQIVSIRFCSLLQKRTFYGHSLSFRSRCLHLPKPTCGFPLDEIHFRNPWTDVRLVNGEGIPYNATTMMWMLQLRVQIVSTFISCWWL